MERQTKDDKPEAERSTLRIGEWGQVGDAFGFAQRKEFAAAADMLARPAASLMAMSAVGLGFASHAFGLWFGAMTGAAQASQHLFKAQPLAGNDKPAEAPRGPAEILKLPVRKPALKVVAKAEPKPAPAPAAKEAGPATETVRAKQAPKPAPAKAKVAPKLRAEAPVVQAAPTQARFSKPRAIERPAKPDDLKAIAGVGPKLEKVLNDLGIWTYAQVAALERNEVAWLDDFLSFAGRIDRDGWVAQASRLAKGTD